MTRPTPYQTADMASCLLPDLSNLLWAICACQPISTRDLIAWHWCVDQRPEFAHALIEAKLEALSSALEPMGRKLRHEAGGDTWRLVASAGGPS